MVLIKIVGQNVKNNQFSIIMSPSFGHRYHHQSLTLIGWTCVWTPPWLRISSASSRSPLPCWRNSWAREVHWLRRSCLSSVQGDCERCCRWQWRLCWWLWWYRNKFNLTSICCTVRSRKVNSFLTEMRDLVPVHPMLVPRPPLSFRTTSLFSILLISSLEMSFTKPLYGFICRSSRSIGW